MSQKNKRILIVSICLVILMLIAGWVASQPHNSATHITDRDTGETYDMNTNNASTGAPADNTGVVKLFGIEDFIKAASTHNYSTDFVDTIKSGLLAYSKARLHDSFSSLTLRPQNISFGPSITGQVRLGQGDEIVPIVITPSSNNSTAILTINKGGTSHGGVFVYVGGVNNPNNLQFTITQVNDTSTDLRVETFSNREAALQYIESLGYNVPDFSITFSNYENPF